GVVPRPAGRSRVLVGILAAALRALRGRVRAGARHAAGASLMTGTKTFGTGAALAAVLVAVAVAWVVAVQQMQGMDMGVATELGSLRFFVVVWVSMMAAMMLPSALPALVRRARSSGSALGVPLFTVSYLAVWTLVGLVVYALYRPHGTELAGAV